MRRRSSNVKNVVLLVFLAFIVVLVFQLREMNGRGGYSQQIVDGVIIEAPRTLEPMGQDTFLYDQRTITVQNPDQSKHQLTYFWREPMRAPRPGEKFPLVVILHGRPGNSYAGQFLAKEPLRSKYPAYILVPVIPPGTIWSFPKELPDDYAKFDHMTNSDIPHMMKYVMSMIVQSAGKYPIDTSRIYVVGCPEGGFGVFGALRDYPGVFAAGVPISGGWSRDDADKLTKVPILAIHGAKDDVIPVGFTGDVMNEIQKHGGRALYIEHANMGHQCPAAALYGDKLWEWVFRQRKAN